MPSVNKLLATTAIAAGLAMVLMTPAHADLIADGITYHLEEELISSTPGAIVEQFALKITGINVPHVGSVGDTEGGRSGVEALNFDQPNNLVTVSMVSPSGYTYDPGGGLNSSGCHGTNADQFCLGNASIVPGAALPAGSSLVFVFNETISSGSFSGYDPHFKINWVGSKNNYDLVSDSVGTVQTDSCPDCVVQPLIPTPEPASMLILGTSAIGLAWARRRRRMLSGR